MKKFVKFCLVGLCNTFITFYTFYLLSELAGINYILSSFTGYTAGMINSFALNRSWTFHNNNKKVTVQFARFIMVNLIALGINLLVMYIGVEHFRINKLIAQLFAMIFSTLVNFTGSTALVFKDKQEAGEKNNQIAVRYKH